ncbi:hypothetical protein ACFX19_006802 [Malus domestica]
MTSQTAPPWNKKFQRLLGIQSLRVPFFNLPRSQILEIGVMIENFISGVFHGFVFSRSWCTPAVKAMKWGLSASIIFLKKWKVLRSEHQSSLESNTSRQRVNLPFP